LNLIDAVALGHDIGHTPFGHAGERAFQRIMRNEVLPLCDPASLIKGFADAFGITDLAFEKAGAPVNCHWLFHHATNSVRIIERRINDITKQTRSGIRQHGWSPWDPPGLAKFGIPDTYEAQAVAIADQVAGLMHDIEDILSCELSEYDYGRMRSELPSFLGQETSLGFQKAQDMIDRWFLPRDCDIRDAWMRKRRLQYIVNSVVRESLNRLRGSNVTGSASSASPDTCLCVAEDTALLLAGCEEFIRERVIQTSSWFRHRDAVSSAIVNTVFTFFRYRRDRTDSRVTKALMAFEASSTDEAYDRDQHYRLFRDAAKAGTVEQLVETIRVVDYVSGMTDDYIMEIQDLAIKAFQ